MVKLKENDIKTIKSMFEKDLKGEVNLMLFYDSDPNACTYCGETSELLKELSAIDSRIKLTEYNINESKKEAQFLGVDKVPALVIGGKKIYNMLYFGIPAGYEFASLLADIIDASKGYTDLPEQIKTRLKEVKKPVDIKVFVTPTCPWCPKAVRTAHQFSMENSMIRSSMIEATEFSELSGKHNVMAVPKIVINDSISFEGAKPPADFLEYVLEAARAN
ncbi:MAG: thioredoxin family protein [Candidatus Marsarchaeota archaeon]|jgi:glutaredoxin-like protein|nr:thioredoxin family protein [Candidatus Marsarchaeota archaeon]